jgi:hypothetical protein
MELDELLEQADAVVNGFESNLYFGTEMYDCDREEFWRHYQIYTGKKVTQDIVENTYFSCSC